MLVAPGPRWPTGIRSETGLSDSNQPTPVFTPLSEIPEMFRLNDLPLRRQYFLDTNIVDQMLSTDIRKVSSFLIVG